MIEEEVVSLSGPSSSVSGMAPHGRTPRRVATCCSRSTSKAPNKCAIGIPTRYWSFSCHHPPKSRAERLRVRGEDPETIAARLAVGRAEELRGSQIADAIVVNDDIERAVAEVAGILARYRTPVAHQPGGDPPRRIPMARRRPTLMDPPVEELLNKVDSKFTLVALSSKRARQINSYYNQLGNRSA